MERTRRARRLPGMPVLLAPVLLALAFVVAAVPMGPLDPIHRAQADQPAQTVGDGRDTSHPDGVIDAAAALRSARDGTLLLIDIRRPTEWRETGIAEPAIEVTMHDPNGPRGFLQAVLASVGGNRERPIALICASGVRSGWARRFLALNGFTHVANMREGMLGRGRGNGWIPRGLPLRPCAVCDE